MKKLLLHFGILIFALMTFFAFGIGQSKAEENSTLPVVQFSDVLTVGLENSPSHPIRVYLSEIAPEDVTVDYAILPETTAVYGVDYVLNGTTLKINKGQTFTDINLSMIDNHKVDGDRVIALELKSPVNATLGQNSVFSFGILDDEIAPVTNLTVVPLVPNGQNNWYITSPEIELSSEVGNTIYYRINNGDWNQYQDTLLLGEGENILDYYAVDPYLNQEIMQSKLFKIDTINPTAPNLKVDLDSRNNAILSWTKNSDINSYQIWRNGILINTVSGESNTLIDQNLTADTNYEYYIVAVDPAGNTSISTKSTVRFIIQESIKEVKAVATEAKPLVKVVKNIDLGSSTIASATNDEIKSVDVQDLDDPIGQSDAKDWNWNKILLVISIFIILIGVGIGLYYGYEWYLSTRKPKEKTGDEKSNKSRW